MTYLRPATFYLHSACGSRFQTGNAPSFVAIFARQLPYQWCAVRTSPCLVRRRDRLSSTRRWRKQLCFDDTNDAAHQTG
jgi:hypothetical protein